MSKQMIKTQKHNPKLRTNMQRVRVAITAKISSYSNNIKVNCTSNRVNSNNKVKSITIINGLPHNKNYNSSEMAT